MMKDYSTFRLTNPNKLESKITFNKVTDEGFDMVVDLIIPPYYFRDATHEFRQQPIGVGGMN